MIHSNTWNHLTLLTCKTELFEIELFLYLTEIFENMKTFYRNDLIGVKLTEKVRYPLKNTIPEFYYF